MVHGGTFILTREQIIRQLHSLLKPVQKEMFEAFYSSDYRKFVEHCSRRLGKSYFLCVIASITCVHKANAQVRYASVTQKSVRKMIHPIMKSIWSQFAANTRPKWNGQEGAYIFKNGSMIHVAGVNNGHADDLRGTAADLAIVDEAGFVDELSYLVDSVLFPQCMPQPDFPEGGRLLMASSSPLSPAHDFVEYLNEAKLQGNLSSFDIYQAGYDEATIEEFCKESGGPESTTWKREYLNEIIVDDELAVIPEFSESHIQTNTRPDYFKLLHRYCAMDIGVRDRTAIVWGYYDFPKAKFVVEAEWSISGQQTTTKNIAENIQRIEKELLYDNVYRRIADSNNLILLQDLGSEFDIHFSPVVKDQQAAMINEMRLWFQSDRISINPSCNELIQCLKFGIYQDQKRNTFARSKTLGHFDMLDSCKYLLRSIDQHTNPIPVTYKSTFDSYVPQNEDQTKNEEALKRIFNI